MLARLRLVAALAGPLAARGVKVGILVGTGYLFTRKRSTPGRSSRGSRMRSFAARRRSCSSRVPGTRSRVSRTPFVARFEAEKQRLIAERRSAEEIREALEGLNVGRLRVATKGLDRSPGRWLAAWPGERRVSGNHGLFMLGQVAALRAETTTIEELHHEICAGEHRVAGASTPWRRQRRDGADMPRPSDIAIVGMAAVFPGAANVSRFWSNTLRGFDAITEIPPDRWDWRLYYDADPKAPDKIISKWGGFLPDIPFDPLRYGMPPSSLRSIEPRNCWRSKSSGRRLPTRVTPIGPFPANRRPSSSAWAAGRPSSRWAMPFVPTCPCSIRSCRRAASRRSRRARACCPSGPRTRFRDSCSTSRRAGSPTA